MRVLVNTRNMNHYNPFERIGSVRIFDKRRKDIDLLFILVCLVSFLWIIPIDFEHLVNRYLDVRNIGYLVIVMSIIPFFYMFWGGVNRHSKVLLSLFALYFIIEFFLHLYFNNSIKNMFYAAWMLVTMTAFISIGNSPKRIEMLFKIIVVSIGLSVFFGLLVSFLGEPFISLRYKLIGVSSSAISDSSIYGVLREKDLGRIVGLCKSIFGFSYQLAILPVCCLTLILYTKRNLNRILWCCIFLISIVGILANAERSALLAALLSTILFSLAHGKIRTLIGGIIVIAVIFGAVNYSLRSNVADQLIIGERITETSSSENSARFYQQVAGLHTLFLSPLGDCYDEYRIIAYSYDSIRAHYGWYVTAPHNHYITSGFRSGWPGVLVMFLIFVQIKNCYRTFNIKAKRIGENYLLLFHGIGSATAAVIMNSFFHNTGMFNAEPATLLLLGLLGAGASLKTEVSKSSI